MSLLQQEMEKNILALKFYSVFQ